MNPLHFGDSATPLFGVYHPPTTTARAIAVLICPPVWHDYMRAHHALRLLARRLADAGFHVLRFDYMGTGDSAGDASDVSLARWEADVRLAADELADMTGIRQLAVVGLQLGATMALRALKGRPGTRAFVLWDPVIRGNEWIAELERLHHEREDSFGLVSRRPAAHGDELLGFPISTALRAELASLDTTRDLERPPHVLQLVSRETAAQIAWRDQGGARGGPRDYRHLPEAGDWRRVDGIARISGDALNAIVVWLQGVDA